MRALIVDCLAYGDGKKLLTRDVIGAGPRTVKGILQNEGVDAKIIPVENFSKIGDYDVIFISGMSSDFKCVKRLVERVKLKCDSKIVIGGPISNDLYLLEKIEADISVVGEGEITIRELLKKDFNAENVKGTTYWDYDNDKLVINPLREILTNLKLITPSTEIKDYKNYFSARVYVEVVRGCSNFKRPLLLCSNKKCNLCKNGTLKCPLNINPGCGFCSVPSVFGYARSRNEEDVLKEIEALLEEGVKRIVLSAPDFLDYKRGEKLINPYFPEPNYEVIETLLSNCRDLADKYNANILIENIKANLFNEKVAEIFSKYLRTPIYIGCESGDENHCKLLGRPTSPSDVLRAVKIAKKYNLKAQVYFIYGLPGETEETAKNTVRFMHKIKNYIDKITVYKFRPLPMSAFQNFKPNITKYSLLIRETANKINLEIKKRYIGRVLEVIISERHFRNRRDAIGYLPDSGLMIVVKDGAKFIGKTKKVKIVKAYEKYLEGKLLEN
ncbi:Radical SAM domain protein [Methanocaldococcus vulcanius M7]|uniref:Radical SAM domain protein n=1 Tax=Methanocaldococcus vulcanius (strain ATCC 700851 / DSM 12094 / M7) TaxID=579137 RepID=C9REB3_METVM|nr:radical SAM protein [Methanocaldococcus vulcanius]ACX71915.1 Radical SAM domain protein [Methanocaldococcus vulcanius M7]